MSKRRTLKTVTIGVGAVVLALSAAIWIAGVVLTHPARAIIGAPPADFPARDVSIESASGALLHGWFAPGSGKGAVLLLHGVRANRLSMLDRARFLHDAGYSVMLVDFQASGESSGSGITFGYLESRDAAAALAELKRLAPGERVGIVGTSMGGAAILLADPPLDANAIVLEQVYPTLSQALDDRLELHAGVVGRWLAPLLAVTVKPRLGVTMEQMRPIDRISQIRVPKLLIVGDADQHTRLAESMAMYQAAAEPKALWVVRGAAHVDLCKYGGMEYRARLLAFLDHWLRPSS
ncbi:alpha/beta fold hydrolase [Rhodanobacter sp. 7MK24]|uniref:alpha/beta hydrolase n=1 Tax=Rhodanobacter sp. 7MK24 TaxID=2775922 RepID=UPI00177BBFA4|nr:alpha/beta fold hydrolase [Rhodanobacter sp. 7MK24]MBD8880608.1 alpha/beta fold hydrolase [Rhodanobacter sp. 7MK24]